MGLVVLVLLLALLFGGLGFAVPHALGHRSDLRHLLARRLRVPIGRGLALVPLVTCKH